MKARLIGLGTAALIAMAGCTTPAPKELPPQPGTDAGTGADTGAPAGGQAGGAGDFGAATAGNFGVNGDPNVPGTRANFLAAVPADRIFFDTDQFSVDGEDEAVLRAHAEYLRRYPNVRATIEGHADERGTREYNIALGDRRANAAKTFLVSLGVPESRVTTISYGKERPDATGSDESSWARNRRAVTVTVQ